MSWLSTPGKGELENTAFEAPLRERRAAVSLTCNQVVPQRGGIVTSSFVGRATKMGLGPKWCNRSGDHGFECDNVVNQSLATHPITATRMAGTQQIAASPVIKLGFATLSSRTSPTCGSADRALPRRVCGFTHLVLSRTQDIQTNR